MRGVAPRCCNCTAAKHTQAQDLKLEKFCTRFEVSARDHHPRRFPSSEGWSRSELTSERQPEEGTQLNSTGSKLTQGWGNERADGLAKQAALRVEDKMGLQP
ncbi:hypothetical protein ACJJTC_018965 [Scirpophaga incertulas]